MSNRENLKMSGVAVAAIVISLCAVLFAPAKATSEAATVVGEGVGYLPALVSSQAKQIEPVRATF